jgi:putative component of toxin-antitoxin plasmid stabilization module
LIPVSQVLLLLGGNKNGQTKDIKQAEKIYKEWVYD